MIQCIVRSTNHKYRHNNQVTDCIDFLKCHANNGVILNGLLIWVWIERRTTADNIWKSQAMAKFTSTEITPAKDEL